jgi:hypothetical protein
MQPERKIFPSVLLLILSMLGFLFSGFAAVWMVIGLLFFEDTSLPSEVLTLISAAVLAILTAALQIPAFLNAIRDLRQKDTSPRHDSLFKPASYAMILWIGVMIFGFFVSRTDAARLLLAPLTVLGIALPIWWLVEFSRRKLPRSSGLHEWGSLSVGLTAAPVFIIIVEVILLIVVGVIVFFALSVQPGFMEDLTVIFQDVDFSQGDLESLERLIFQLAQNPLLAGALLFIIGLVAPFVEELFKPVAVWFLLRHPLKPHEGFSLGLISGGAFALLESAGLVSQINPNDWLVAICLRAATGILHIGLSGFVGYGFAKAWNDMRYGRVFLHLLIATGLHGTWNALALINGYSTSLLPAVQQSSLSSVTSVITLALMAAVFISVIYITLRVNRKLRNELQKQAEESQHQTEDSGVIKSI